MEELMSDEILANLEKHMEGNQLALAAVAEVLQKMDARLLKEEEDEEEEEMEKAAEAEKDALVKSVTQGVIAALKADQGMDVDGDKTRSASQGPAGQADEEKPANPTTKIEDQQATIQAMQKADEEDDDEKEEKAAMKAEDDKEEDEDAEKAGGMEKAKAMEDDDDDDDMEKAEDDTITAMRKELDALKKQLGDAESNIEKAVQEESESRLRKMGFREETSLQAPKLTHPLGTDGTTPIVKGDNPENTVDQLASLSYKELRDLQSKIEMGDTDGVPRELIGK